MFSPKSILAVFAFLAIVSATPADLGARKDLAPPTVTVCSGNLGDGCVVVPVVSSSCVNLDGGLSFLNKEISTAQIPDGLACTFLEDFGCLNGGSNAHDAVVLTGGTWNFVNVQGISGSQNFNDLTSSFTCSPV